MADGKTLPFSVRNRGARLQIDNDFPEPARVGLLHVLADLKELNYVEWREVIAEIRRIARLRPGRDESMTWAAETEEILLQLEWDKVFDFCERLYSHLARPVMVYNEHAEEWRASTPRSEVQKYIATEVQRLFQEENFAFEFLSGVVRRRGRRHTMDQIARSGVVLGDPRLSEARMHYNKALKCFQNVADPDYENAIKEAVCAVEAVAQVLFSSHGRNLDDIIKTIEGNEAGQIPKPIAKTFSGLYGFRNSGKGVAHGIAGAGAGAVTKELAEYALAVAASQIVLLVDFSAASEPDIPF